MVPALDANKHLQDLLNDCGDKICIFSLEIKLALFSGMNLFPILRALRRATLFPASLFWWLDVPVR
jgi:hypothetical protein